jgi:HicB family
MIQIRLEPEIEARLSAEAQARGLSLDRYIIEKLVEARPVEPSRQRSVSDAIDTIRELRRESKLGELQIKDLIHEGHKY